MSNDNLEGKGTSTVLLKSAGGASAYQHSFGLLADRTPYVHLLKGVDVTSALRDKMKAGLKSIRAKALTSQTGGAGSTDVTLVPIFVDQRLVDISRRFTPLVELIPRVTNQGLTADYNRLTAKGGGVTAAEDAALNEVDDTYARQSTSIKFLYSVGRVTGPAQAAVPSYILEGFQPSGAGSTAGNPFTPQGAPNAKQLEVLIKARALKELEESLIVNGDLSTTATEFDGIVRLQGTTNQNDLAAAALTWDDVEDSLQDAFDDGGRPKLVVCSSAVETDLRKIMIDTFRFSPEHLTKNFGFGLPPLLVLHTRFGPIPVVSSMFLSNVSGAKQCYFLDTDFIEMRVLQDMTFEDLAKTNDSSKFMLKIYECLIFRAPTFNSFIDNIA